MEEKKKTKTTTSKTTKTTKKKTTTKKTSVADKKETNKVVKKPIVKEVKETKEEKKENNVAKSFVIAIVVIILLFALFMISEKNNEEYVKPETFTEKEQADLNNISVNDYLKLKAGSDVSVIYIARPTCSHCQTQTPRMKYIKYKYGVEINYLNTDEITDENDYQKLFASDTEFFGESGENLGTPTILIVKDDKIVNSIAGESEVSRVVSLLKEYNLIEK